MIQKCRSGSRGPEGEIYSKAATWLPSSSFDGDWSPQRNLVLQEHTELSLYELLTAPLGPIVALYVDCVSLVIIPSASTLVSPMLRALSHCLTV